MNNCWRSKQLWFIAGLTALGTVILATPIRHVLDHQVVFDYLEMLERTWAIATFLAAHIVATTLGVPGTVLVIAGGAVFGLIWGSFLSVIGATLGAIAAFLLSRYLLHDWFNRRFQQSPRLQHFRQILHHNSLHCVLAVRFAPISPFNLANFLFGLTPVSLRAYTLGTFIGIIPGTIAYTWLGVTGHQAFQHGNWYPFAIASSFLVLLSVIPLLARHQSLLRK